MNRTVVLACLFLFVEGSAAAQDAPRCAAAVLWLEGAVVDGAMVMTGPTPRPTPQGAFLDRITWTPLEDGRVRQFWEVSPDGGTTWKPYFDGYYGRGVSGGGTPGNGGLKPRSFDF